jgi:iron complex outermembrane recepter protein
MWRVASKQGGARVSRIALLITAALPVPAFADEDGQTTIIVTARRQEERASEVPLAISRFDTRDIGTGAIDSLQSLAARVPGLSFEAGWGGFFSTPALRGQNQPNVRTIDGVGMFIDGVYQANRDAVDAEPLDLERIEVVHGPQSALFGHSSFSGLIHFIPARPTESLYVGAITDIGTDNLFGMSGTVSGPVGTLFKARLAASWRTEDGTHENAARIGQHLGNSKRFAIAASVATRDGSGPLAARISARFGSGRSSHPASFALDHRSYNCGGRDLTSGFWSYFCGRAPLPAQVSVSPDIPDSRNHSGQIALHMALDAGGVELRSDTSYYRAKSNEFRDFDGSAEGELYGVCTAGVNCGGIGSLTIPVVRLQLVDMVLKRSISAREFAQELRIRGTGSNRMDWQIGGTVYWTQVQTTMAWGGARGNLAPGERFSSLVLSNPQRVGAPAAINFAVVDDPDVSQVVQSDVVETRRTFAMFATGDYRIGAGLRLRGEVRATWERQVIDSRRANFVASFGTGLGARNFQDITPRFSLDWRPADGWLLYASYAKGSRSGGINTIANLVAKEQTFEPETNWTAELGARYSGTGLIRNAHVSIYDIDWRNTQILGLATTPGVNALIVRNTRGVHTRGVEFGTALAPAPWLELDFAYSHSLPRFKQGSEDPGGSAFCGLALGVTTSSFCTISPSLINPGQAVPDISGNRLARAVETSWTAGLTVSPSMRGLHGLRIRADLSHQSNVFDGQINGLYFGARTLLGARVSFPLGRGSIDLWGTNLGDARYVRFAAPRAPAFYTGIPRPTDLILGEGRRMGVSLRLNH